MGRTIPHVPNLALDDPLPLAAVVKEKETMIDIPRLIISDNEHTRALGIAGMQAVIETDVATGTYWAIVTDMDGMPAGPFKLTVGDLEVESRASAPCYQEVHEAIERRRR